MNEEATTLRNPNYQNTKIYRIVCNKTGLCYYGATTRDINHRLSVHKWRYDNYERVKKRYTSSAIIESGDYNIELVEMFPCNSYEEMTAREDYYIKNFPCVNKQSSTGYADLFKTDKKAYMRRYRQDNKDRINANKKKKRINCVNCGKEMLQTSLTKHKNTCNNIQSNIIVIDEGTT